ncbi:hypothetical protein AGMMS49992_15770 [Clostridia bacterium]|nr:hypothetical protein AGMMS49992_15770 [Clostridia bacterium]
MPELLTTSTIFRYDTSELADKAAADAEIRRDVMLRTLLEANPETEPHGGLATIQLCLGKATDDVFSRISRSAEWFERIPPGYRTSKGEGDFTAQKLFRGMIVCPEKYPPALLNKLHRFYQDNDFFSMYESENHRLLSNTPKYLYGTCFPDAFLNWCGETGMQAAEAGRVWLREYLRFHAAHGWAEFDSNGYMTELLACLIDLYDFSRDEDIKMMASMSMDTLLLDMILDSVNGLYGGAHGRISAASAMDHTADGTLGLYHLYFGHPFASDSCIARPYAALMTEYRPDRRIYEIALGRVFPYINKESCHLHCIPLDPCVTGNISKYTYCTAQYTLGAVNWQDEYPTDSETFWYAHHQQHEWAMGFAANPRANIFTHHPGSFKEHNHWVGDLGCCCVRTFSDQNVVLATYDIENGQSISRASDTARERRGYPDAYEHAYLPYINAYLPSNEFDETIQEGSWWFVRLGDQAAGLYSETPLMPADESTRPEDPPMVELRASGLHHACVCEASLPGESFAAFQARLLSNPISFNKQTMALIYRTQNRELRLAPDAPSVNGETQDFPYPTFDSPYVHSEDGSPLIRVNGPRSVTLYDFEKTEVTEVSL